MISTISSNPPRPKPPPYPTWYIPPPKSSSSTMIKRIRSTLLGVPVLSESVPHIGGYGFQFRCSSYRLPRNLTALKDAGGVRRNLHLACQTVCLFVDLVDLRDRPHPYQAKRSDAGKCPRDLASCIY